MVQLYRDAGDTANARDTGGEGLIPGLGRFPREGKGNSLQYFCLENSTDRGVWRATVAGITKSWPQLSDRACARTHTHRIKKNDIDEPICRAGIETQK